MAQHVRAIKGRIGNMGLIALGVFDAGRRS
jgi:hypothetical protein